ncbi:peptidase M24 [Arcobacter sp. CECT 8983]|uniref:M23 family metallopeptidase n=1 Tax=Arcobacter sp. CECT 8983 TaxID=2044508 RepID=UPI00100B4AB4|nr:M23 family metallopeptidase [Arcobacter sp. CECT 8983]RXJ89695.1 peptidase M24 [Arcobacter sp. CECT 8983]
MKKIILLVFIFLSTFAFAKEVQELSWPRGETFLTFLEQYGISQSLYYNLPKEDKELCSEINEGTSFHLLLDEDNSLKQVLIPVSEDIQLHIAKQKDGTYKFQTLPISYQEIEETLVLETSHSPYLDIMNKTNNKDLANELIRAFKSSVNFRGMQKGDFVVIKYKQKIRLGKYFGQPEIIAAMVEVNGDNNFIFRHERDGQYYDIHGKSLTNFTFKTPVRYTRISSRFQKRRYHPVLKRYRAHLGVDYAAPRGRKIYAAADGRIIFRGRKGGYGNTIIIQHKNGLRTLYAHQYKFKGGLRSGSRVKKGQHIGYVGSTGLSSGPHLHLGLYRNGRAIDPLKIIKVTKSKLKGKEKRVFINYAKTMSNRLKNSTKDLNVLIPTKLEDSLSSTPITIRNI